MAAKDIEKLKDKFEKDPNSKLFLPLAEEYRKEGLLDQAIDVLQKGLEKHQAYTSARVLLGKIYFEKGLLQEARKEFEGVVASVPDNLFAYKKLSEIYRDTGETELAIRSCRAILKLNPMDGETVKNLEELESAAFAGHPDQEQILPADEPLGLKMSGEEEASAYREDAEPGQEIGSEAEDLRATRSEDELNAFKDSLFGGRGDEEGETPGSDEETVQTEEVITLPEEEVYEAGEELTFEDVAEEMHQEESPVRELTVSDEGMGDETADVGEDLATAEAPRPVFAAEDIEAADRFIAGGEYVEAMGVYRQMLSMDPENKMVLQRADELRALLRLMGKDKELRIAALDAFLEGVKKGRDEFFGRS
jgi:tetratricopeptide (TPR) repeat protein